MTTAMYIMAIDQGTTSTRAIIYNHQGQAVGSAQKELTQFFPQDGWVEHDGLEIWDSVQSVIAGALIEANLEPGDLAGIGITNQRETTLVWDKQTGKPIHRAVVWQSRQSAELATALIAQGHRELFHQKTGLVIDAYFSATKIRWLLDHVPGAQSRAEAGDLLFGTVDTWLLWKLTKGQAHKTDYANASRTMLFNIHELKWDQDILDLLNIPCEMLPTVHENAGIYGYTDAFPFSDQQIPISGMAGDQQAALFGQIAFEEGMVKNTYGTGSFIVMNTGATPRLSTHNLLTTIAYGVNGAITYALEGSIFVTGSAIQWLRDGLHLIETVADSEALALKTQTVDDVYIVPAFTGLGAPYWDPAARGAIFGLTRKTTDADLTKATLQAIAYQTRDVVETMIADTGIKIPRLKVDGGAAHNQYLMEFQADILNIPVQRAADLETTALGVAFLAGLGIGYWQDLAELKGIYATGELFEPEMSEEKRQRLYRGWKQAVAATQAFKLD